MISLLLIILKRDTPWPSWQNKSFSTTFPPKNTNLDNYSWMIEPLWKFRSPREKIQNAIETKKKKSKIGSTEKGKKRNFTFPMSPLSSKAAPLSTKREFPGPWQLLWGKWEHVSAQISKLCRKLPKRPNFLLPHPEYWRKLCDSGAGSSWKNSRQDSWRISKWCGSH